MTPGGFVDARADEAPDTIDANLCIVGAGAAGLTLARRLAGRMDGVVLIESGGFDIDGETQNLFAGRQLGLPYHNLTACRLRFFGGTTNHWGGYCRANDPIDYEGRPELDLPSWPVGIDALTPYIDEAAELLQIDAEQFDAAAQLRARGIDPTGLLETQSDLFLTKIFQLTDALRLGPLWRADIAAQPGLTTYTHLNLTHVQLSGNGRSVAHLDCATLTGRRVRVTARQVVLACHGIENARILLASDDVMSRGIGNDPDHVGRYFMDHIYIRASRLIPTDTFPAFYDNDYLRRLGVNANLSFTDATLRDQGLLQYYCRFRPEFVSSETRDAMRDIRRGLMQPGDLDFLSDLAQVASELRPALRSASRRFADHVRPEFYLLEHRLEQAPNPASRVVLSDRRDALGNRIADLDWQIADADVDSFARGQAAMGRELAALGMGRLEAEEITRALVEDRVVGHYHQIGTTRMSAAPADGVVDADGRVHGVENLYVTGSSVFPTAGYSGPTMMLMALAMRLGDHLADRAG